MADAGSRSAEAPGTTLKRGRRLCNTMVVYPSALLDPRRVGEGRRIHSKSQENICRRCVPAIIAIAVAVNFAMAKDVMSNVLGGRLDLTGGGYMGNGYNDSMKKHYGFIAFRPQMSFKVTQDTPNQDGRSSACCVQATKASNPSPWDTYLRLEAGQRDENVAFCFLRGYSYSQPQGTVFGSLFGTLLVIFGIGLLAYSCFLPRRCKRSPSDVDEVDKVPSSPPPPPPPPQDFVTVGAGHLPWICTYPPTRLPSQKLIHTRDRCAEFHIETLLKVEASVVSLRGLSHSLQMLLLCGA
ncbi:hypothetical protein EGR_08934 [Echinococcus granulosus]|uniref:Uncharacterized protein n=1 Tax=Echinococcus granulosus TaxID=6210 RepID=W6U734_ECHGR|nr:hypothetical protein EGR_08934 [Echinococcus granulosus]EUB56186.1 hypothetical protein EGR_08934 [Echinococcus granulosus]